MGSRGAKGEANFDRKQSVLQIGGEPLKDIILNADMKAKTVQKDCMINCVKGRAEL